MTRRQLEALERRVQRLHRTSAAAVGLIMPTDAGYRLEISREAGGRTVAVYSRLEDAEAAFDRARPTPRSSLILIDV